MQNCVIIGTDSIGNLMCVASFAVRFVLNIALKFEVYTMSCAEQNKYSKLSIIP